MMGKTNNTFVVFFTESVPDSGVGLLFGWRSVVGRTVDLSGAGVVPVGGCKGD